MSWRNTINTDLTAFLCIGLAAAVLGFLVLSLVVHRELGGVAKLGAGGKWMLTLALGMGVFAFSMKMAVALAISQSPAITVAPLIARHVTVAEARVELRPGLFAAAGLPLARYRWDALPEQAPAPFDNPGTPAKIALGRRLFYERRLSADGTLSCSSCHNLFDKAGGDGRRTAQGIAGQIGPRNAPTVWNAAFQSVLFWDGRARSLEEQAKGPILNAIEMGLPSPAEAERRLNADATYRAEFARAFGDERRIKFERIAQALAAFERILVTPDTPYDRFVRGRADALTTAQLRGMALFQSVGCILCHRGPAFSDASLLGGQNPLRLFPANPTPFETQYGLLTESGERGVWRIPSLRNVALTGPWLHNGSVDKLDEVVRIMAGAQLARSGSFKVRLNEDRSLETVDASPLNDQEVADLVAFLKALSSDSLRLRMAASAP